MANEQEKELDVLIRARSSVMVKVNVASDWEDVKIGFGTRARPA